MNRQQLIDALHKSIDPVAQQAADFLESTTSDCHACALADEMIAARDARIAELEQQLSGNPGEFAAPAGEQVGLTDDGLLAALNDAASSLAAISNLAGKDDFLETMLDVRSYARSRANVAADEVNRHIEAKRASCSRTAESLTHEAGRVDETGKSEHVGGAA